MENKIYLLSAPWCSKCSQAKPMLYSQVEGVEEVNIDEDPSIPAELGVLSIPTLVDNRQGESVVYTGQSKVMEFISKES